MILERGEFNTLHAIIDKEVIPYTTGKSINKKYNVGHIKKALATITPLAEAIPPALLAQMLRQKGVAEMHDARGVSYFAISNRFFKECGITSHERKKR